MTILRKDVDAALALLAEAFPSAFTLEQHMPHRPLNLCIDGRVAVIHVVLVLVDGDGDEWPVDVDDPQLGSIEAAIMWSTARGLGNPFTATDALFRSSARWHCASFAVVWEIVSARCANIGEALIDTTAAAVQSHRERHPERYGLDTKTFG